MSISRSEDGLPSESQLPRVIPKDDDKDKQPFVEPSMPQASTPALPIVETVHGNDGLSFQSQSPAVIPNDDDKSKQSLVETPVPQASTPEMPSEETEHHKACRDFFKFFNVQHGDYLAIPIQAEILYHMLKHFGLASYLKKDELGNILKLCGYVDDNDAMDFELFTVFAEDFKIFESLRMWQASRHHGQKDRGPLGDSFAILEAATDIGFTTDDFKEAFRSLDVELTDESADILVRYAGLHTGVKIIFDEFLKVLRQEHEKYMLRTSRRTVSRRMDALDRGQRVGRLMAFVSAYTRQGNTHFCYRPAALKYGSTPNPEVRFVKDTKFGTSDIRSL